MRVTSTVRWVRSSVGRLGAPVSWWPLLATIVVFGLLDARFALASIPDASGVFHACYHKSSANMRIIDSAVDSCKNNETEVTWSKVGPPGATGQTGATGPAGPTGPSDAYVKDQKSSFGAVTISTSALTNILTLSAVPPGSYVLFASAAISGPVTLTNTSCTLTNGAGVSISNSVQVTTPASGSFTFAAIPINTSITLASATDISISCRTSSANVVSQPSTITAIKVGALH